MNDSTTKAVSTVAIWLAVAVILVLAVTLNAVGFAPAPFRSSRPARLPVGRWTVKFANSVVETCEVWPSKAAAVKDSPALEGEMALHVNPTVTWVFI